MIGPMATSRLDELVRGGFADPDLPGGRVHLFDVRDGELFQQGHVPGARHLPHEYAIRWVPQQAHTEEAVVLIDDDGAPGGQARETAAHLAHKWFHRLYYLQGGYAAWQAAGLPHEQGGAVGAGAASFDGTQPAYHASKAVSWQAPTEDSALDPLHPRKR